MNVTPFPLSKAQPGADPCAQSTARQGLQLGANTASAFATNQFG